MIYALITLICALLVFALIGFEAAALILCASIVVFVIGNRESRDYI